MWGLPGRQLRGLKLADSHSIRSDEIVLRVGTNALHLVFEHLGSGSLG
jgi:hypothetical protein